VTLALITRVFNEVHFTAN